jgi:20S proteasome subunit beta 1
MLIDHSAGIIIAGYDPRHGGHWREQMTEQEGIDFVRSALQEAIKWDGSSGGVIRLVVLTKAGAVRHLYLPDNGYTGPGVTN